MTIAIIDYGMGNLGSVRRGFEECGADCVVAGDPTHLSQAKGIVLPGVGSFKDGMEHLSRLGFVGSIRDRVAQGVPLLGICLGMQLLAEEGEEGGVTRGLGLVPGHVRRLKPTAAQERVPHVGWNEVHWTRKTPLSDGLPDGNDFYFVHSYHFAAAPTAIAATTPYCGNFVSVIADRNVYGTQFHPEKSSRGGLALLKNFLNVCRSRSGRC